MKSRTILILLTLVAVAVAIALLGRKPPPPLAGPSKPIPTAASVRAADPVSVPAPTAAPVPGIAPPASPALEPEGEALSLLAAIEQALASPNPETREFALTHLLPALALADPFAAGRLAETNTLADGREALLQHVAKLLAAQDPTNALTWAAGLRNRDEREAALTDVCLQLAETNPAEAISRRESLLAEYQSYEALEDLAQKWAEKDLAAALAWIAGHPRDARRDQLIGRAAFVQAQTSPREAARLVFEDMTPGEPQIEAAVSVLHQWGKQDLAAATAWAERFPEGPLRTRALQELAGIAGNQNRGNEP